MKVVHVPFTYFPDAVGGTEVYVADLARGLRDLGIESVVAAPSGVHGVQRYDHDGVPVYRFGVDPCGDVAGLYDEGDESAARAIAAILEETHADVLHLHAFTRAASLRAARRARRDGVPVVFTYHTPTASCVRGTLLRDGRVPCDGSLDARRCATCLLESHGVPAPIRAALARVPASLGAAVGSIGADARWITALRTRELVGRRHSAFARLLHEVDAMVAVCAWVRALLVRAGAREDQVVLSRQGTPARARQAAAGPRAAGEMLRLAFVGRLHPTKGLHVALHAIVAERDLPVTLDVYGVAQDEEATRYARALETVAAGDPRVRFRGPLAGERVVETIAGYHATVVPSQWLETGPLVALESFAAGVPVIGSNLGGIAELVTDDRDGWLVAHDDDRAWRAAFRQLVTHPEIVERLRRGVRPPRSTDDVARDMASLYESVARRREHGLRAAAAGAA